VTRDVDLILDTIGGETLRRSLEVAKPGGALVSLLERPSQEQAHERGIQAMNNAALPIGQHLEMIAQLIDAGQVTPTIERIFALHEAPQAHEHSQRGHGRIVLHIADD
jgi:NADPH:quinone reductase-like Zn-dependent oxidoreductase